MLTDNTKLPNGWSIIKFSDCILQLTTGLNPRNNFSLGDGNLKYITAKNLSKYDIIDFTKCDSINEKSKEIINKRSDIKIGDILFSSRDPVGHSYLIKEKPSFYDIGESIFSIRVNKEVVLPQYLNLYLSSDQFVRHASKFITGSVIKEIRIGHLKETLVIVPPMDIQKKISHCISSIDKKIEVNNLINDNL